MTVRHRCRYIVMYSCCSTALRHYQSTFPPEEDSLPLEPIIRQRLHQQVAREIEGYIAHHRLRKGDPLPTETEFASRLKVNRSTVRVAVKGLEMLGILTFSEGSGYAV